MSVLLHIVSFSLGEEGQSAALHPLRLHLFALGKLQRAAVASLQEGIGGMQSGRTTLEGRVEGVFA